MKEARKIFFFLLLPLFFACAGKGGKPELKFRVIEVFPPPGFQIPATQFSISAVFSKILDEKTINDETVKVFKDGIELRKLIAVIDRQKIKITPEIISRGKYKVFISKDVRSLVGDTLGEDFSWEFSVVGEGITIPIPPPSLPPLVKSIYPPHGAVVGTDTIVYAVFTKKIINISSSNFFIQDISGKIVDSSLTYIDDGNMAILRPKNPLQPDSTYIVTLKSNITASDGESLGKDVVWIFFTSGATEDKTPPEVIFINPPNGATGVPKTAKIYVIFSENIDTSSVNISNIQIIEEGTGPISYTFEYNSGIFQLTLIPSLLQEGKAYTIRIKGIRDLARNTMEGEFVSSFSVEEKVPPPPPPSGPGFPPEIIGIFIDDTPVNLPDMPQGVSTNPTIKIFFSDKLDPTTVNDSTVFIHDGTNKISSTISLSTTLTSVALIPNLSLESRKTYWVFITDGIRDQDGEILANPVTFPFKTLGIIITSPSENQYLKGIINISVDFSGELNRLELWIDSSKRQVVLPPIASPHTFTEDTRSHPDGTRIIKAVGYLKSPSVLVSYSVRVTFDNTSPTLSIQSPPAGAYVSGTINPTVIANDSPDGRIKRVEFYVDNVFHSALTNPTTSPNIFSFNLDTTTLSDGSHTLSFRAEDLAGNISDFFSSSIVVDNTLPSGSFISPSSGETVGGNVTIEANVSDNTGVKKVEFYVNSVKICDAITLSCDVTSSPWKMIWDSSSISYQASAPITGVVEDLAGNKTVFSTSVTVDNTLPSVSINTPSPGMYIRGATTIQVSFSDSSPVTWIAIFINDDLRFSASNPSSPYNASWDTTAESDGTKTIRAVVYDIVGNSNEASISVVVDNTPPSGSIISPSDGTYTNALTLNIEASPTDNILLDRVEFYVDGSFAGFDDSSPTYEIDYNISALPETSHDITAVIFDFAGNFFTTSPVTFIIDRTPPSVDFVDPLTDSVVSGTKLVKTTASDSGIVTTISIEVNSTSLGSCTINATSGDCDKNWSTSGDANNVVLKATAQDKAGNQGITQIAVMVDNLFPSVSITSPTGFYLTCPTNTVLGGEASDTNTITAVVIRFIDLSSSTVSAEFTFSYSGATPVSEFATLTNSQCTPDGDKRVEITAYDKGGKSRTAARDIFVDNTPPELTVIYPPDNECVSGVTKAVVQICDNAFVQDLSATVNTTLISSTNISSSISCDSPSERQISWNSASFSEGSHTLSIYLTDQAGNVSVQNIPIVVDNSGPTVSFISPSDNSAINSPVNIQVTLGDATCPPPTYPFKKVEYLIAVSGTSSFSSSTQDCSTTGRIPCTDTNVGSGSSTFTWSATEYCGFFKVKARGYDYAGNVGEATITLKIQPPGCPIEESWSPKGVIGAIRTIPIIKDLDGDGEKEIIFGTDSGRVYAISRTLTVQNSSDSGSAIRSNLLQVLVSGIPKGIFGMLSPAKKIKAINLSAPFLADFASVTTETAVYSSPVTIFADGNTAVLLIGDLAGRVGIYEINSSGFLERSCIPTGTPLECGLNSPAISDINGDTQPDITTTPLPIDTDCDGFYDTVMVTASDGYITAISLSTRAKIWTIYTGSAVMSSPVLVDFGNDCNLEILVGTGGGALYCIPESGSGNCPGWTSQYISVGGSIYSLAVTDVDSCLSIGDTEEEIIFGAGANLTIVSNTGMSKSQRNLGSFITSIPAIADINGDGCGEIFVATQDGKIHGFRLENLGGSLYPEYITGFPKSTGGNITGTSPIVCDIDSDSILELAIGNDSSTLRVYDLGTGGVIKWIPGATFCNIGAFGCQRRWDTSICGY